MTMHQQVEQRLREVTSAVNEVLYSKNSESTTTICLGARLPPAHIQVQSDIVSLVAAPLSLQLGDLTEMTQSDGELTRRYRTTVRRILNRLHSHELHTINENGEFIDSDIARCKQSDEKFMMYYFSSTGIFIIGIVTLDKLDSKCVAGDRVLFYQLQNQDGDSSTQEFILESAVKPGESVRLEPLSSLSELIATQWRPPQIES